jgi:C-terminal processing protease CtpA/Prc
MSIFSSFFEIIDKICENQETKEQNEKMKDDIKKIRNFLNIRNINNDSNNNDQIITNIIGNNGVSKVLSSFITNYMNEESYLNINDNEDILFCECSEEIQKDKKECVICIEEIKDFDVIFLTKCKHIYHKECIMKWLENNKTCPTCRYNI